VRKSRKLSVSQKRKRDEKIFELYLRCFKEKEIAQKIGIRRQTVSLAINNAN